MELTLAQRKAITQGAAGEVAEGDPGGEGRDLGRGVRCHGLASRSCPQGDPARAGRPAAHADHDRPREPVRVYDDAAVELLTRCWAVLDGPTGKRLRPALPESDREPVQPRPSGRDRPGHRRPGAGDVGRHHRPPPRRGPDRAGGPQADQPHPARVDAEVVDPDEDLAGVDRHRARVPPDRPGRPRGRRQQRRVLLQPRRHRHRHRLDRNRHRAVQG